MKKFLEEFKKFAIRGNVMDLAVAVIIGGAFGKIVTSLVNDLVMPMIGVLTGGVNFSELTIPIGEATIKYGAFLQSVVDFLIIALAIFIAIKQIGRFQTKEKEKPSLPPKTTKDQELLTEIRDLLKK